MANKDKENLLDSVPLIKRLHVNSLLESQEGAPAFACDLGQGLEEEAATLSRLHLDKRISIEQSWPELRDGKKTLSHVAAASQA